MQNNNNNTLFVVGAVVVGALVLVYFFMNRTTSVTINQNSTTTESNIATQTAITEENKLIDVNANVKVAKIVGGYPSSWPSDVPKYPNGTIVGKGGNNPNSQPTEAVVVFTTDDSVKSVVNFYLNGLRSNGWTITEDGAGTANMTTFRASKGKRSMSGYAVYENKKTEVTLGVNAGM